jgi:hypothetical protein
MSVYIITCTAGEEIQVSHEYLGDARGRHYATRQEAQEFADYLTSTISDFGLPADTTYTVAEA